MELGRRLLAELDLAHLPERILAAAVKLVGPRPVALEVLDPDGAEVVRVLGARAGEGPGLVIPILVEDRPWGALRVSMESGQPEPAETGLAGLAVLASFAGTAIENAQRYDRAESGRLELMQSVRGLEAARTISDAIGAEVELASILELIVKRGRTLVDARSVMIMLAEGEDLVVVAGTGTTGDGRGTRVPIAGTLSGRVLTEATPMRIDHVADDLQWVRAVLRISDIRTALMMPLINRGVGIGVLMAVDRGAHQGPFSDADERLMATFASSAANAVSLSHSVEADRLAATIAAAEDERRRWARELHDQTLQALGGLRVVLSGARRHDDLGGFRDAVDQAVADLEYEIQNLRGIIADLRPPLLDDLGLADALTALISRHRDRGLAAELTLDLGPVGTTSPALAADLETTVYRLVQEALANVVKHARASVARVSVLVSADVRTLVLEVSDDGVGFDTGQPSSGFGLGSIRERVYLAGGELRFTSSAQGTVLHAQMPLSG